MHQQLYVKMDNWEHLSPLLEMGQLPQSWLVSHKLSMLRSVILKLGSSKFEYKQHSNAPNIDIYRNHYTLIRTAVSFEELNINFTIENINSSFGMSCLSSMILNTEINFGSKSRLVRNMETTLSCRYCLWIAYSSAKN